MLLGVVWSLTAVTADTGPATAWALHGCRYSGSTPTVEIKFNNVQNLNANAVKTARIKWNAVNSPVTFVQNNGSSDPELDVYDQSYSTTSAWAWIDYSPEHGCSSSGTPEVWNNNETDLHINNSSFNARTKREKWIISVHELGHALGLDHSVLTCTSCLLYTSPSPRDATLSRMPSSA